MKTELLLLKHLHKAHFRKLWIKAFNTFWNVEDIKLFLIILLEKLNHIWNTVLTSGSYALRGE